MNSGGSPSSLFAVPMSQMLPSPIASRQLIALRKFFEESPTCLSSMSGMEHSTTGLPYSPAMQYAPQDLLVPETPRFSVQMTLRSLIQLRNAPIRLPLVPDESVSDPENWR